MSDSEALAAVLPMARNLFGLIVSKMQINNRHGAEPESAFNSMATAMAALYKLGYDLGRAEASVNRDDR